MLSNRSLQSSGAAAAEFDVLMMMNTERLGLVPKSPPPTGEASKKLYPKNIGNSSNGTANGAPEVGRDRWRIVTVGTPRISGRPTSEIHRCDFTDGSGPDPEAKQADQAGYRRGGLTVVILCGAAMTDDPADSTSFTGQSTLDDHDAADPGFKPIPLNGVRRSDGSDGFRFRLYFPDELLSASGVSIDVGTRVQARFDRGKSAGEEDSTTSSEDRLPAPAVYLRPIPDNIDQSVQSTRKVRTSAGTSPFVQLPPKLITSPNALGLDGSDYCDSENQLLFQPVSREKELAFVPIGFENGASYELSTPDPDVRLPPETVFDPESASDDTPAKGTEGQSESSEGEHEGNPHVVRLIKKQRHSERNGPDTYRYRVYLRATINEASELDVDLEAGDSVSVVYDDEGEADPAIMIGKIPPDQNPADDPTARKITSASDGMAVNIPSQLITSEHGLGLSERWYDPAENALLFEVLAEGAAIMLTPIGFEDGTPFPRPPPPTRD